MCVRRCVRHWGFSACHSTVGTAVSGIITCKCPVAAVMTAARGAQSGCSLRGGGDGDGMEGVCGGKGFLAEGPAMGTCRAVLRGRSRQGRSPGARVWGAGARPWWASWPAPTLPSLRGALGSPRALREGPWEWIGGGRATTVI